MDGGISRGVGVQGLQISTMSRMITFLPFEVTSKSNLQCKPAIALMILSQSRGFPQFCFIVVGSWGLFWVPVKPFLVPLLNGSHIWLIFQYPRCPPSFSTQCCTTQFPKIILLFSRSQSINLRVFRPFFLNILIHLSILSPFAFLTGTPTLFVLYHPVYRWISSKYTLLPQAAFSSSSSSSTSFPTLLLWGNTSLCSR